MEVVLYLTNKYEGNTYMSKKLEHYLENLPQVMQGIEEEYQKKMRLKRDFIERRDNFIEWFINHHGFYYHAPTEQYLRYIRNTFFFVPEDELIQMIMLSLHVDFNLHRGKEQMKRRIIRRAKRNILFSAQPNNITVDNVLRYLNPFFSDIVKRTYFLTCVGDVLLGKRNLIYFLDPSFKPFIYALTQGLSGAANKHISENFKFKYYDHDYTKCRIIPGICDTSIARMKYIDVAVVATSLSNRYGSSDVYLTQCNNTSFEEQTMILHNFPTPSLLVESFLVEYTVSEGTISYKTIYFLWKIFLFKKTLPCMLSQHNFKQMLVQQDVYDHENDVCKVQSKYPLSVLNFEMFWSQCVTKQTDASYTVEEFIALYQDWCDGKQFAISNEELKEWMETFFTDNFHNDTITGFKCKLWDKTIDIENALEAHTSADKELYEFYCEYTVTHNKRVATKEYFDKYVESR